MKWFLFSLIFLLSGCSGLPKTMRNNTYSNISLAEVKTNIARYKNTPLRWGGTIINVVNEKESSQIQVLFYPIGRYGRPLTDRKTEGRFAISSQQFLDPALYKESAEITVTGILSGEINHQVGEKTLTLPLLAVDDIHIWPDYQQVDDRIYPYYYHPYYQYSPFFRHPSYFYH